MLPSHDARHGTTRGFHAGCRCAPCRRARARYEKESRLIRVQGGRRSVLAIGAQRRIQALMRLGWSSTDIAQAAGWSNRNDVLRIINGQKGKPTTWLEVKTDQAVRDVFERLSMKLPDMTPVRARTRSLATKKGYLPPLAWDDDRLDDPNFTPSTHETGICKDADEIAVVRFLEGDFSVPTKRPERELIVAEYLRLGRPLTELERAGWKPERYMERRDGAA